LFSFVVEYFETLSKRAFPYDFNDFKSVSYVVSSDDAVISPLVVKFVFLGFSFYVGA